MTITTDNMESAVEAAMPAVLDAVEAAGDHRLPAGEVIAAVRESSGLRDEPIRHAIWRLIGSKRLELTDDRELAAI